MINERAVRQLLARVADLEADAKTILATHERDLMFVVGCIIGGLVSYPATAIGAILVGLLESYAAFWDSAFKEVLVFSALIPILIWRSLMSATGVEEEIEEEAGRLRAALAAIGAEQAERIGLATSVVDDSALAGTAAALATFGVNEWAARLVSLLAATGSAFGLYVFMLRWNTATARIALLVLATTPFFFAGAQFANLDMQVAACINCSILCAAVAVPAKGNNSIIGVLAAGDRETRLPLRGVRQRAVHARRREDHRLAGPHLNVGYVLRARLPIRVDREVGEVVAEKAGLGARHVVALGPADLDGLLIATGHFRGGILLTPITAKLVREWVTQQSVSVDWDRVSPMRFQSASAHRAST